VVNKYKIGKEILNKRGACNNISRGGGGRRYFIHL
jgi:hypothetical protein